MPRIKALEKRVFEGLRKAALKSNDPQRPAHLPECPDNDKKRAATNACLDGFDWLALHQIDDEKAQGDNAEAM